MKKFKLYLSLLLMFFISTGQVWGESKTYTKVSSVTTGKKYLVVYQNSTTYNVFDGSNPSNGCASASISFSPTDGVASGDYSSYTVTISDSHTSGKYLILSSNGKYLGRSANSNGMDLTTTKPTSGTNYDNAITYNNSAKYFVIAGSGGRALGSNSGSWKYYSTSNAYTHLDLYEESGSEETCVYLNITQFPAYLVLVHNYIIQYVLDHLRIALPITLSTCLLTLYPLLLAAPNPMATARLFHIPYLYTCVRTTFFFFASIHQSNGECQNLDKTKFRPIFIPADL